MQEVWQSMVANQTGPYYTTYKCFYACQQKCWNLIITPFISHEFYSWIVKEGSSNLVAEIEGLEFEFKPCIPLRIIISVYINLYGGASVAQTSGPSGGALADT
jgi:hypothetical protein